MDAVHSFQEFPSIKLVYFFGSRAQGDPGPLSDYDYALYLDEQDPQKRGQIRLQVAAILMKDLKTDAVDVVILNDIESPELKFNIIHDGTLLYEVEPFRIILEPKIMNEYFDFRDSLRRYGLTA